MLKHFFPSYRYRHQLENFVDKVKGREPMHWMDADDSVANMEWIERIYEKVCSSSSRNETLIELRTSLQTGLGSRPKSTFVLETSQV